MVYMNHWLFQAFSLTAVVMSFRHTFEVINLELNHSRLSSRNNKQKIEGHERTLIKLYEQYLI